MSNQRQAAMWGPISAAGSSHGRAPSLHPPSSPSSTLRSPSQAPHINTPRPDEYLLSQQQNHSRRAFELDSSDLTAHQIQRSFSNPGHQEEGFSSFFDDYASHHSFKSRRNSSDHQDRNEYGFRGFNLDGSDDEEDFRDLNALNFSKAIRMNLDMLTRSSADYYAQNVRGYPDPNAHYHAKVAEVPQDSWFDKSYPQLISRLSLAQDGVDRYGPGSSHHHEQRGSNGSHEDDGPASPKTSSSSRPTASLTSGRSSSEVNDDELQTPPEPYTSYEGYSAQSEPSRYQEEARVLAAQQTPSFSSPSQQVSSLAGLPATDSRSASPPQHSFAQTQHAHSTLRRPETQQDLSRYAVGDSSELEMLSDDLGAQRRAAGKARMQPEPIYSAPPSSVGHSSFSHQRAPAYTVIESNKPFTRLGPQDVAFSATKLTEHQMTPAECIEMIVASYPSLCDAPVRMFGEDGKPLPPTKKEETSEEERQARKQAIRVKFCAKERLSLIKAMVLMESRSASWRRLGPLNPANTADKSRSSSPNGPTPRTSGEVAQLPPMPSPWSMEIRHEQLDVAQIKGKSKKTIELAALRINAKCHKCEGSGLGACGTCKGEKADECFWCTGTGREKTRAQAKCRRCQGAGVLKCHSCNGSLKAACRSCEGTGSGEYGFFVDVIVKRIHMPAVPISTLFPQFDPASSSTSFEPSYDEVKEAATIALWDSILKLTEARNHLVAGKAGKSKSKSKEMVPVMAACVWENSTSHVVAADIPLQAKFKKGSTPALRPEGLARKIPTQRKYFTVPTDADLKSIELSEAEVKKISSFGSSPPSPPPARREALRHGSGSPMSSSSSSSSGSPERSDIGSPSLSSGSSTPTLSPPLATPRVSSPVSGYSTPSRVPSPRADAPPARPAAKEFIHRPSPLSQLAAASLSPAGSFHEGRPGLDGRVSLGQLQLSAPAEIIEPTHHKSRSGHGLKKKFSSNLLNKLSSSQRA